MQDKAPEMVVDAQDLLPMLHHMQQRIERLEDAFAQLLARLEKAAERD